MLGRGVGLAVGIRVGENVGGLEGAKVGATEGFVVVGRLVGNVVGISVGAEDGYFISILYCLQHGKYDPSGSSCSPPDLNGPLNPTDAILGEMSRHELLTRANLKSPVDFSISSAVK